ncbi:MAG: NusG domain II-containing protein [Firmicutes bacterium]|nr:NusG domain II-containing protein [Bacillota bacterium]
MKKENMIWLAFFLLLALVCFVIWQLQGKVGNVAVIRQDGKTVKKIDLNTVTGTREFDIEYEGGHNTVEVQRGKIRIKEADCPDKVCVNTGYISTSAVPIVCLPHKLTITIDSEKEDVDVIAGK